MDLSTERKIYLYKMREKYNDNQIILENASDGKLFVRKTIDDSGDYPLTTYSVVQHYEWGDRILVESFENPYDAVLLTMAKDLLKENIELRKKVIKEL